MAWEPDYVDVVDLRDYVRIPDDLDDAWLALAISAASRAVDRACNRQFGLLAAPGARYYTACWNRELCRWVVEIDDVQTAVGFMVSADLDDSGEYATEIDSVAMKPINAAQNGRPWTSLVVLPDSNNLPGGRADAVEVTARWGWTAVPAAIEQATALQASRFAIRRNAPYGIAGSPADGSEMRLLAKLDPDVAVAVQPFVRWWGAA